jgi:RNA polymerase sigma-32 factor
MPPKPPKSAKPAKPAKPKVVEYDEIIDEPREEEEEPRAELSGNLPAISTGIVPDAGESSGLPATHQDLLKRYLDEVSRYALLSPEEEFDLAVRLKEKGDLEAARRLVAANLRFVVKIAMEYRSAYLNVMDLIQEGNIGLMKAVSKFDPSKGAKLSYYASWWIRSYILKYILDNFRLVRVGTTQAQKKLFFHLMREKERLEAQGFNAGPKLLADRLNVREQDVVEMEQRLSGRGAEVSLNKPIGSDEEDGRSTYMDLMAHAGTAPDEELAENELRSILAARIEEFAATLKDKELAIFRERLAAEHPKTLQEVADQFGLTRERVRQIEVRVIEKLREYYGKYIR